MNPFSYETIGRHYALYWAGFGVVMLAAAGAVLEWRLRALERRIKEGR